MLCWSWSLGGGLLFASLPRTQYPVEAASIRSEAAFANAVRFRETFGLDTDHAVVEQSLADEVRFPDETWGVPLAESEAQELGRRVDRRAAMGPALQYAHEQPDFAGVAFDQRDGGRATFWFTDDIAAHRERLEALAPSGQEIRVSSARYTEAHPLSVQASITKDFAQLIEAGIPVETVGVEPKKNAVVVSLRSARDGAEKSLRELYGPTVETDVIGGLSEDSCSSTTNCGYDADDNPNEPWKDGIRIIQTSNLHFCTSTLLARKGSNLVMITAGHCLANNGGSGPNWKHHGQIIGNALGDTIVSGASQADVGWIDIDNGSGVTPRNKFFVGAPPSQVSSATDFYYNSEQEEGDVVCRIGTTSGYLCGVIDGTNIDKSSVDGHEVLHLWRTNFDASEGDSGGTMFFGPTLMGIHADSKTDVDPPTDGHSWYTTAWRAQDEAGIDFCFTSGC